MLDAETTQLLQMAIIALERLADHFAPIEAARQIKPATLSTARYERQDEHKAEFDRFRQKPAKRTVAETGHRPPVD